MASTPYRDPQPVIRALHGNGILNRHLQAMLKSERLSSTGVKAEMQNRVVAQLRNHAITNPAAFDRLKAMIENPRSIDSDSGPYSSPQPNAPFNSGATHYANMAPSAARNGAMQYAQQPVYRGGGPNIEFKPSPFYKTVRQIGDTKVCDRMEKHRHSVNITFKTAEHPDLLNIDPTNRVFVFCASNSGLGRQEIEFPHQSEIKVNGEEYKKSLRGIKKKPGTSRPVDITSMLRLKNAKYPNVIEMTYALTPEKYYLVVYLVKMVSVEVLAASIAQGKKITKASVVNEMVNKARDPDIVVGSSVLSLKCPLSTLRIDLPCRATTCKHNQCFDATSYLQLQEQGPTWLCPICNNPATFDNLAVDGYVLEILHNTPTSVDQVTIEPNGTWSQFKKKVISPPRFSSGSGDDDDDIIEIKDSRVAALKNGSIGSGTANPFQLANTPPGSSREPSSSVGPQRQSNGKRPASSVIDLTLSDDDDEPISRPAKRVQYGTPNGGMPNGSTPNGLPHRSGYLT